MGQLSPEGLGVLRALGALGKVRHFDAVALELIGSGNATVAEGQLVLTPKGKDTVKGAKKHRKKRRD